MEPETLALLERIAAGLEQSAQISKEAQADFAAAKREGRERYDKQRRDAKRHADAMLAETQATGRLLAAQAQRNLESEQRAAEMAALAIAANERAIIAEARAEERWQWERALAGITAPDDASALTRVPDDREENA